MSLIDTTFAALSSKLVAKWGQEVTLVQYASPGTYDPATGQMLRAETLETTTAVVTSVRAEELQRLGQQADVKILVDPGSLPEDYLFGVDDEVIVSAQAGSDAMVRAKAVDVRVVRGERGILWVIYARYQ
jgi:hypothetical protein